MGALIYLTFFLAVIFLGWPPFLYRRFCRDGRDHPLGRAILWFACFYYLSIFVSDTAFRHPLISLLPLVFLAAPLPVNLFMLIRALAARKK